MKIKSFALLLFLVPLLAGTVLAADFALVVNKANSESTISENDAKNIFLGKKTAWENGTRVIAVTQENSPVHEGFTKEVVKKTPAQFSTFWKKALFTGTGTPPKDFGNDSEMKAFVAANPGGIGYIARSALDGSVKELRIQ